MAELDDLIAEYNQHKQDKINPLERAGDYFGGIDERLDYLAPKVFESLVRARNIEAVIATIPGIEVTPMITEQIPFSFNLAVAGAVNSAIRLTELAPFSGNIKYVTIHWPNGTNALVDVRVGHDLVQFCPRTATPGGTNWLALNDATPMFTFTGIWVEQNNPIWVEMQNRDGGNTHNITVVVMLEGVA